MGLLTEEMVSVSGSGFADGIEFEETFPEALPLAVTSPTLTPQRTEAVFQQKLDRRLREAEETIERLRLAEEQRASDADGVAERVQRMLFEWQDRFEQSWRSELEQVLAERLARHEAAEPVAPVRTAEVRPDPRNALATATSARDVGRIVRDLLGELTHTSAFALSLHDAGAHEVAYRYRIASDDDLGALLRRDMLDDGPQGAAANGNEWTRAQRTLRVGSRNVVVHTAQHPLRTNDTTVGVLTLQSDGAAIPDGILAKVFDLAALAAPRLAVLRDSASFKGV
ncbi:MAG: hypothetical protein M3R54_10250 [Chloroflexota bacterium]|nr:hypothetical protein [Chloroflexota bacterium]